MRIKSTMLIDATRSTTREGFSFIVEDCAENNDKREEPVWIGSKDNDSSTFIKEDFTEDRDHEDGVGFLLIKEIDGFN